MRPRKGPNRTHYLLVFTESNRSSLDGSKWRSLATFATTPTRVLPLAVHGSNAASLFVSKLVGSGFDHTHDEVGPEGNVKTPEWTTINVAALGDISAARLAMVKHSMCDRGSQTAQILVAGRAQHANNVLDN